MKKLANFLLYFFILLAICGCNKKKNEIIPQEDQKKLEAFFDLLVRGDDFAYTLFGDKPCSIADYGTSFYFNSSSVILEEGWNVWLKYNHLFPSQNFVLKRREESGLWDIREIVLINKKLTLDSLKSHLEIFQKHLLTKASAEEILSKMLNNQAFFNQVFESSHLLGILLGYGKVNAEAFEQRLKLSVAISELAALPFIEKLNDLDPENHWLIGGYAARHFEPDPILTKMDLKILCSKLNALCSSFNSNESIEFSGYDLILEKFQPPVFAIVENDIETQELNKKYSKNRETIMEAYQGKSMFEVTMNQWKLQ